MKNRVFMQKTPEEKRRHLSSVLRSNVGGFLDDGMIGRILPNISLNRQYAISAFSESQTFREAVARAQAGETLLSMIFSKAKAGPVAAVITPLRISGTSKSRRAIIIYAPSRRKWKGAKKWARTTKTG